jgi:multiple sugar transport system permease protein
MPDIPLQASSNLRPMTASSVRRSRAGLRLRKAAVPYAFCLPALLLLGGLIAYPVLYGFWLSFHSYQMNMPSLGTPFVGLQNYIELPRNAGLVNSVTWTLLFTAIAVPIECAIGLAVALVLHSLAAGRTRSVLRSVLLIPMMMSGVVVGFMWKMMFDAEFGPVNHLLSLVGIPPVQWLAKPIPAQSAVIVSDVWLTTPFVLLILLAGLQTIPEELHEAARIDGASAWQGLIHVTLPLLRYAILVVLIIRTMDALRVFDQIYALTKGGPGTSTETVMYYTYQYAFAFYQMGRASAVSFVILLAISSITFGYLMVLRRGSD